MRIRVYAKLIVAAIGAAASALTVALNDQQLTSTEIITAALAALTALGVYAVPNKAQPKISKRATKKFRKEFEKARAQPGGLVFLPEDPDTNSEQSTQ